MANSELKYRIRLRWQVAALLDMSGAVEVQTNVARSLKRFTVYEIDGDKLVALVEETHTKAFGKLRRGVTYADALEQQRMMREAFHYLRRVLAMGPVLVCGAGE